MPHNGLGVPRVPSHPLAVLNRGDAQEPGGPDVPMVIQLAAFATKSAKIRSVAAQCFKAAATRAFRIEGAVGKGRTIETPDELIAREGSQQSQPLRFRADQPILVPNSSYPY